MRLPLMVLACAAAFSAAAHDDDAQYAISAPGTALTGYVAGTTLAVSVTAPSGKHADRVTLRLNGKDVTSALHPDASGALSGTVSGLTPGANTLQLFAKKDEVATLTVMKGMAPAATCESLATLVNFPIQPVGTMGGTTVTTARIVAASGTTPEYCLVQGIMQE